MMVSSTVAVIADNPVQAMPGDSVTVESSTKSILGAAIVVYLVPFALFFLGYFLGASMISEGMGAAFGGIGFAVGVLLAILADRRLRRKRGITFRITAIEPGV